MYAITGITGKVGGTLAEVLLRAGAPVRAVLRDKAKAATWQARGCETAFAEMEDAEALAAAFAGTEAVFILPPPEFDPAPGYPEARQVIEAVRRALLMARPRRVLCLSTIGADAVRDNLLSQRSLLEEALVTLPMPVTFLRPCWFMDNALWDVASAREEGLIRSYLMPLDRKIPMVATADVGRAAAHLIRETWVGTRILELEGPSRVSPNDIAMAFTDALGRNVTAEIVPPENWEPLFRAQGMRNPTPRIRMLEGFNDGWIDFTGDAATRLKGQTGIAHVIADLTMRHGA